MIVLLRTKKSNKLFQTGLLLFGILLLNLVPLTTTAEAITFEKTYGGALHDYARSVQQTLDGGYVAVGRTASFGAGRYDVYLVKTDPLGNVLWERTYGGSDDDAGYSVQQTLDRGYIIAGWTMSFGAGWRDVYLIKTDSVGNLLWQEAYGGDSSDEGKCVGQTSDRGYIIAGYTASFGVEDADVYLIKTDSLGNTLWERTYGGSDDDGGQAVRQTLDRGYIIAGWTRSFGGGEYDVYLIRADSLGNVLWDRAYGGSDGDGGSSVQQTLDRGYIIAGGTESFGAGSGDVYLVKTDSVGNMLWERTYGGGDGDGGGSVQQTLDRGYIIAGWIHSFVGSRGDVYLIKTDSVGIALWERTYGGNDNDFGYSVHQTLDRGYIIAGGAHSFGAGGGDVYLIKTDENGLVGTCDPICLKQSVIAELDTLNPQSKHVAKGIKKAKKHIEKSLESKRWLDGTHLHHKHGKKVFYEEKKAVKDIKKLCKKGDFPDELCERLIGMLVEADSILARVAIDDAKAANGNPKEIEKAEKEMAKAEKEKEKGKYDKAIDHYKKAWQHAMKAVKHHKPKRMQ